MLSVRRIRAVVLSLVVLAVLTSLAAPAARADGIIIVEPPPCAVECPGPTYVGDQLVVKSHRVDVTITDQVATTKIDQVFHNPNDWVAEGTYVFPIPEGATVDNFTMIVDGEPIEAKILTADEARRIYDDIVRTMRDPALLEYVGRGAIQASVFPIQPGQDRQIQIEYQEVVTAEGGLVRYLYPLNTERFSAQPLQAVSVRVAVESAEPIRAVYSPSHRIAVDKTDERHFTAGWEASNVTPDTDFSLIYTVSQEAIGANLLSYWDAAAGQGTFMLLAAPGIEAQQATIAKDMVVVLDTSGSMDGEKIVQAKAALTYVLEHLNAEDRFNVVEFSTGARMFASELQPASAAAEAASWVGNLSATGGTDINLALLEAMAMVNPERPTYILFLTDGLPTEGETDVPDILRNIKDAAPENVRLFAFGVGYDVDTVLLDTLTRDHHGASTYVQPGQPLDEVVSAFYAKVSTPVLTDLTLDFGGVQIEEIYPRPLPDLFAGTQLVVVGKYRGGGPVTMTLSGTVNGQAQSYVYEGQSLVSAGGDEFLPRLWATRKIGYLLNQIRLNGENQEWIQTIVDLSVRYGIVTPYTSYLITEDDILTEEGRDRVARDEFETQQAGPAAPASGEEAVVAADAASSMGQAGDGEGGGALPTAEPEVAEQIRSVGARTFVNKEGVWIETTYDPSRLETIKVQFASEDYFRLLKVRPDLAEAFALGERVIAVSDGVAFEVVAEEAPAIDFEGLG
ncbi:MAG: VIT domain-containing protein [Thermomicrobiales bacterium]